MARRTRPIAAAAAARGPETMKASDLIKTLDMLADNAERGRDALRAEVAAAITGGSGPYILEYKAAALVKAEYDAVEIRGAAEWLSGRNDRAPRPFAGRWEEIDRRADRVRRDAIEVACDGPSSSTSRMANVVTDAKNQAIARVWLHSSYGLARLFRDYRDPARYTIIDDVNPAYNAGDDPAYSGPGDDRCPECGRQFTLASSDGSGICDNPACPSAARDDAALAAIAARPTA
jgi:hypothetical protein